MHSHATRVISEANKIEDQAWQQLSQSVDKVYQQWGSNICVWLDFIALWAAHVSESCHEVDVWLQQQKIDSRTFGFLSAKMPQKFKQTSFVSTIPLDLWTFLDNEKEQEIWISLQANIIYISLANDLNV